MSPQVPTSLAHALARAEFLEAQLHAQRLRTHALECALLQHKAQLDVSKHLLDEIARRAAQAARLVTDARAELLLGDIAARAASLLKAA